MNYESEFEIFASVIKSLEGTTEDGMASEIFQAIGTGKSVIDGLKTLTTYAEEVKDIGKRGEFMRIIGELNLDLAKTEIKLAEKLKEASELKEQVNTLQQEIKRLKNPENKMIMKDSLYYGPDNDGPFCTGCYDNSQKSIRLIKRSGSFRLLGAYRCPNCGNRFEGG
jgi:CII-binding regulator of phage lambda lysogenization HflD